MDGKRLIRELRLTNFLSYGDEGVHVELQPLNVLIGANGSGKSNFIEAFRILQAAPNDLTMPIIQAGGIADLLWKGQDAKQVADIMTTIPYEDGTRECVHYLSFTSVGQRMQIVDEMVDDADDIGSQNPYYRYNFSDGKPYLLFNQPAQESSDQEDHRIIRRKLSHADLKVDQSILSQLYDPYSYPQLSYLGDTFSEIRIYADINLGRSALLRQPQLTDLPNDVLEENYSNFALLLNDLDNRPGAMQPIMKYLKLFYERVESIGTKVLGGTMQVNFREVGLQSPVPANRLSDGTLRFLCLLVILLHPTPPPLVCIEEPELGMHPDIIPTIAELLIDASQRTQLIVTTHSDLLVSKIGEVAPEAILVCDRTNKGTTLTRLDPDEMTEWLKDYSLGEVWMKGAIGGTRW